MPRRPPLDPAIAASRGLSPQRRAELDATAKDAAMRFTWAVKARNAAEVHALTRSWTWENAVAVAIVLAEGISPGDLRLLAVTRAASDGAPKGRDVA